MHQFDQALELNDENGEWHGETSAAYANMVGPFGGITAAALLKAIMSHPDVLGDPLTMTVNYTAPVKNGAFAIKPTVVRTNRSTQHWFVTMMQGDEVVTSATAVFAVRRESWAATDLAFPTMPADMIKLDSTILPGWVKNYTFHFVEDVAALFASASDSAETLQTIRDNPPRPLDFLSLAAYCDSFFPRIMIRLGQILPIGTVAFTVYFHADGAALAAVGDGEVIGHARANRYSQSYFDQSAEIWSPNGTLLATTTQIVYFKAKG